MSKKHSKHPHKNNPLLNGDDTLFDEIDSDIDFKGLTKDQQADKFISKWLLNVHPFTKFRKYFSINGPYGVNTEFILNFVKIHYGIFVHDNGWSEQKYAICLDHLMSMNYKFSKKAFENIGEDYELNKLPIQVVMERQSRRKERL